MEQTIERGFLQIDGLPGESRVPGFEGQIELTSFQYGCNQPTIPVQSAEAPRPGRAMHYMVKFTKHPDSASSGFCQALWMGKTLPKAVLTACRLNKDSPQPFLRISLENVVIADYNLINSEGGSKEIISMNFAKIEMEYLGEVTATASHDLRTNEVTAK